MKILTNKKKIIKIKINLTLIQSKNNKILKIKTKI